MKSCTRCGQWKLADEFQVRRASADGLTASCKACLSLYDKSRASKPNRVEARRLYSKTERGMQAHAKARAKYEERNLVLVAQARRRYAELDSTKEKRRSYSRTETAKQRSSEYRRAAKLAWAEKYRARNKVASAIRDGRLIRPIACLVPGCGKSPEAHHWDYSRPLAVLWICPSHHKQLHATHRLIESTSRSTTP